VREEKVKNFFLSKYFGTRAAWVRTPLERSRWSLRRLLEVGNLQAV
jgi:hypothetical protein